MIYCKWYEVRGRFRFLRKLGNFGDDLNPILIRNITGYYPINARYRKVPRGQVVYIVIGSIIHWADSDTVVWGAGFGSKGTVLREKPKEICAVRGPLTRKILMEQDIECPEVYGDPALLYPRFYRPRIEKRYRVGLIPHYTDFRNKKVLATLKKLLKDYNDTTLIDVRSKVNIVIDKILSCEYILSSSLHGLIIADSYRIPSLHVSFEGSTFSSHLKFKDYFLSVKREWRRPVRIRSNSNIFRLLELANSEPINIDLDLLYSVCPFLKK